jgi:hypothetical protein
MHRVGDFGEVGGLGQINTRVIPAEPHGSHNVKVQ